YDFAPSNPAASPCNPRRHPTPRCHQIMNAEEMSKTPTIRPAGKIARNAPEFFIAFRRRLLGKAVGRIDISLVFLFSCIPDLLLSVGRNAFAHSNSNRSSDL